MSSNRRFPRRWRLQAAMLGGALLGLLTGAASGEPAALALGHTLASGAWVGGALGFIGGALTGLVAGDS